MVKSVFITAIGTDVGKTYVSGLILKKMREYGVNCGYFKPVLSGAIRDKYSGKLIPGDCCHVVKTAGLDIDPMECVSYCFEEALSPHLASKRAGVNIDINKIKFDYNKLSSKYDYMIIEGAGGITCPIIDNKYLMWNLVKDLDKNVLVVSDSGLGCINSAITTLEYIKIRNIEIKGVVFNNYAPDDFMHRDNLEMVESMSGVSVVSCVGKDDENINIDKENLLALFE